MTGENGSILSKASGDRELAEKQIETAAPTPAPGDLRRWLARCPFAFSCRKSTCACETVRSSGFGSCHLGFLSIQGRCALVQVHRSYLVLRRRDEPDKDLATAITSSPFKTWV